MTNSISYFIMAQPQGAEGEGGGNGFFIMLGLMFVVMYFFMIRPQAKRAKKQQQFREELKKGDKIITSGGIHGKIAEVRDTALVIDTEGGGKLKIEKSAVSMQPADPKDAKDKK